MTRTTLSPPMRAVLAAAAVSLALAACSTQDPPNGTPVAVATSPATPSSTTSLTPSPSTGTSADAGVAVSPSPSGSASPSDASGPDRFSAQDRAWLVAAHRSNLAEIAAGRSAQRRGRSADVRAAGRRWVRDHTTLDASVQRLAYAAGVALPSAPTAGQRAALATVEARSGAAYDRAWIAQQTSGHDATLAATDREIGSGQAPGVVSAARAAKPVIQAHMDLLDAAEVGASGGTGRTPSGIPAGTGGQAATGDATTAGVLGLLGAGFLVVAGAVALRRRRVAAR